MTAKLKMSRLKEEIQREQREEVINTLKKTQVNSPAQSDNIQQDEQPKKQFTVKFPADTYMKMRETLLELQKEFPSLSPKKTVNMEAIVTLGLKFVLNDFEKKRKDSHLYQHFLKFL